MNYDISNITGIIFDFDGVLTDNTVYVSEDGTEMVRCNRADGFGFEIIRRSGIPCIVISSERNDVVKKRCDKLKVDCVYGVSNKVQVARDWINLHGLHFDNTLFIGNDINDIPLMQSVGHRWCVNDAWTPVCAIANLKLDRNGGEGIVREVCEKLRLS